MLDHCDICGEEITEDNATSYGNICVECAGGGSEILMHFLGG